MVTVNPPSVRVILGPARHLVWGSSMSDSPNTWLLSLFQYRPDGKIFFFKIPYHIQSLMEKHTTV